MSVNQTLFLDLVARASTFWERVAPPFVTVDEPPFRQQVNDRIGRWKTVAAQADHEHFMRRLKWGGINPDELPSYLGTVRVRSGQRLPRWARGMKRFLSAVSPYSPSESSISGIPETTAEVPFQHLLLPLVAAASRRVARSAAGWYPLTYDAQGDLRHSLLQRISKVSTAVFYATFDKFRQRNRERANAAAAETSEPITSTLAYDAFVATQREKGMMEVFVRYPVLLRLMATVVEQWVEATREFLHRLRYDAGPLQDFMKDAKSLGNVEHLQTGLSDPHQSGRSVMVISFTSGRKLVYKPRPRAMDSTFFNLLEWLNGLPSGITLRAPRILDRGNYAWVEHVAHQACHDEQEVATYYARAGGLLALLYAVDANDCHFENLLAAGADPVLVDPETLFHQRPDEPVTSGVQNSAEAIAWRFLAQSVLATGILPGWHVDSGHDELYDISALGATPDENVAPKQLVWENVNTDQMCPMVIPGKPRPNENLPQLNGRPQPVDNYRAELLDGFQAVYSTMVANREALTAPNGPLGDVHGCNSRFLFRNTRTYAQLLQHVCQPRYLEDGADFSIELEYLARAPLNERGKPVWWPILRAEQQALVQLDIPIFQTSIASACLHLDGRGQTDNFARRSSWSRVCERLDQLGTSDLERQSELIQVAFCERSAASTESDRTSRRTTPNQSTLPTTVSSSELVARAKELAEQIRQRAFIGDDGSACWLGFRLHPRTLQPQAQPVDTTLYSGTLGVGLFFAALWHLTQDPQAAQMARAACIPVERVVTQPDLMSEQLPLGAGIGIGSIILGLVSISQLLDEVSLLDQAERLARRIDIESILRDTRLSVVAGSAGALLGLLALYKVLPSPGTLERARWCGEHLLDRRTVSNAGLKTWTTLEGRQLAGMAHGAAGISYALMRLFEATEDAGYLRAAEEAIAYERTLFSVAEDNWPDLRHDGKTLCFMNAWCHGATGIALARLGSLSGTNQDLILEDIEAALRGIQAYGLGAVDQLCCGNFGRIDLLLTAAERLKRPDLAELAQRRTASLLQLRPAGTDFHYHHRMGCDAFNPGLFQGASGIGYQLLRLAYPTVLPSLLLFEPCLSASPATLARTRPFA